MEKKEIQHVGVVDLKQFEETHEEKILLSYAIYDLSPSSKTTACQNANCQELRDLFS